MGGGEKRRRKGGGIFLLLHFCSVFLFDIVPIWEGKYGITTGGKSAAKEEVSVLSVYCNLKSRALPCNRGIGISFDGLRVAFFYQAAFQRIPVPSLTHDTPILNSGRSCRNQVSLSPAPLTCKQQNSAAISSSSSVYSILAHFSAAAFCACAQP